MAQENQNSQPSQQNNKEEALTVSQIELLREQKLQDLRAKGVDAFPAHFDRSHEIAQVHSEFFAEGQEIPAHSVNIAGRVMAKRNMGKAAFITVADFSGKIQVYGNNKNIADELQFEIFSKLDIGDIIGVGGECFRTQTNEPSLRARNIALLSKNISPLPIVKEKDDQVFDAFADVEARYRRRYVDLVVNESVRNDFVLRFKIIAEIRSFLQKRGFLEVETPMMQAIASGAAARPFATHHNTLDMPLYLRIAPELYLKRLIVGGFEKVFELNRNFRNEGISTKHNPEFTMMEIYQAYADFEDMLRLTEDLFVHLADTILQKRTVAFGEHIIDLSPPWPRKGYLELIQEKSGVDFDALVRENQLTVQDAKNAVAKTSLKIDLRHCHTFWEVVDEVFSQEVEPTLIQPIFVVDFPKAISPLAKEHRTNPALAERFEPYIAAREMGNAFSELNDPFEQKLRFEEQLSQKTAGAAETMELDEDFIDALKVGMPPTGGLGIGIDRLVMLLASKTSIKDVILFPLLRKKA